MAGAAVNFSDKVEYYTPKSIVNFFGPFDYDPATTKEVAERHGILHFDTRETNGLAQDWTKYEKIWCNPPFTLKFDFLEKCVSCGKHVFILLPISAITTKKFNNIVKCGYTLWIPDGRIKFNNNAGKYSLPAFGSIVLELGKNKRKIIKTWSLSE